MTALTAQSPPKDVRESGVLCRSGSVGMGKAVEWVRRFRKTAPVNLCSEQ